MRIQFAQSQIVLALRQARADTVSGGLSQAGISEATFCSWKKKYSRQRGQLASMLLAELQIGAMRLRDRISHRCVYRYLCKCAEFKTTDD